MAASLTMEEEFGVWSGDLHPHNGYYAGDFSMTAAIEGLSNPAPLEDRAASSAFTGTGSRPYARR